MKNLKGLLQQVNRYQISIPGIITIVCLTSIINWFLFSGFKPDSITGLTLLASFNTAIVLTFYKRATSRAEKIVDAYRKATAEDEKQFEGIREVAVFFVDQQHNISYINREMIRLTGYTSKELIGRPWTFMCTPKLATQLNINISENLDDIMQTQRPMYHLRRKDGIYIYVINYISLMESHDSNTKFQVIVKSLPTGEI
ncbi:PAS domain-containing protein [Chitinophaga sp. Cy-1792]|uniref:PAS domain-containing protein n=1 Tax=Chitinophaga sp. Cy-1792 TaxID=2608339 RepID=UPI001420E539|nr:PAS domain-containing protein [Chitinophaga sp. Cy-1792]NIG54156.1 PAS domain S-box protein [Chitinophaga sp. Cy-1792]